MALDKQTRAGIVSATTNDPHMAETTEIIELESERAKVESWRLHVLIEAGYPLPLAERVAVSEADLHEAAELVSRGCEPRLAAQILL